MKYSFLAGLSLAFLVLQFISSQSFCIIIPAALVILVVRNPKQLIRFLGFITPALGFLLLVYSLTGQFRLGIKTILLLCGTSLSLQLYFGFYPELSLYELLLRSGFPKKPAFIIYGALNYTLLIKPLVEEIMDAQRLRGVDIPKGPAGLFYLPALLIPLMVRLLQGAEYLAESLSLRAAPAPCEEDQDIRECF